MKLCTVMNLGPHNPKSEVETTRPPGSSALSRNQLIRPYETDNSIKKFSLVVIRLLQANMLYLQTNYQTVDKREPKEN